MCFALEVLPLLPCPVITFLECHGVIRPVHLLRVSVLRVLESNFPGNSLYSYTDMRIRTP